MRTHSSAALLLLVLLLAGCATTSEPGVLRGRVVGLADGDTITVLDSKKSTHRIRLQGIDAPERGQPFSKRSGQFLSELVFDKEVEVLWEKRDRWNRILGKVMVADPDCGSSRRCPKIDANLAVVEAGLAWWYRHYAREQSPEDRKLYEEAELRSCSERRGLWGDPAPVPPWEWRRKRRSWEKPLPCHASPPERQAAPAP